MEYNIEGINKIEGIEGIQLNSVEYLIDGIKGLDQWSLKY